MSERFSVVTRGRWSEDKLSVSTLQPAILFTKFQLAHTRSIVVGWVPVENLVATPFGDVSLKPIELQRDISLLAKGSVMR